MADDLASAHAQIRKLQEAYEPLIKQVSKLEESNKELRRTNNTLANSDGLLEKQYTKTKTAIVRKNQKLVNLGKTLFRYTKGIMDTVIKTKDEQKQYEKSVPILTRLMIGMTKWTNVSKLASKAVSEHSLKVDENTKFMKRAQVAVARFGIALFSLISLFTIVAVGLMMLSAAFQGTESPILDLTTNLGPLHDAMQGMIMVTTGEGEGGLAGAFNVLAASVLVGIAGFLLFGPTFAVVAAAAVIAAGAFQLVTQETGSMELGIVSAIASFGVITGSVLVLKTVVSNLFLGTAIAVKSTIGGIMLGVSLVLGGIVGLVYVAMGYGSDLQAFIITIVSGIAIFLGLAVMGVVAAVGAVPIAIGIAVVAAIVLAIRFKDELIAIFWGWVDLIKLGLVIVWTSVAIAVTLVLGYIAGVWGAISGFWIAVAKIFVDGWAALKKGPGEFLDFILTIPGRLITGLKEGFKTAFNAVIDIYNDFVSNMGAIQIPDWVPKIGGEEFELPQIPRLAKGGVVNTPTLAMIGEAGPEAVVPLNRASQFGKTDVTVNINVSGVTDRSDKRALAREISDIIAQEMRRNGGAPTRGRY